MKRGWIFFIFGIIIILELGFVNATNYNIIDCTANDYGSSNVGLQRISNDLTGTYTLANDINCNSVNFASIGESTNKFTGSIDGRGFKIYGLHINKPGSDYVGLIGSLGSTGNLADIVLVVNMTYGKNYVGSLVGRSEGIVRNCIVLMGSTFSGVNGVKGDTYVGGLVGFNLGTIIDSSVNIKVDYTGTGYYIGGLVGYLSTGSSLTYSNAKGNVNGITMVGGLVGYVVSSVVIESCYATGIVTGTRDLGGLVGDSYGTIRNSYATGNVVASADNVGGLVGNIYDTIPNKIINSYATGTVSGTTHLGGLIGNSQGSCSPVNTVNSYFGDSIHNNGCGTLQAGSPGAFYASTHSVYTGTPPWDFTYIWNIDEGVGFPYLKSEKYCGDGLCRSDENCSSCNSDCGCTGGDECQNYVCLPPKVPLLLFVSPTRPNNDLTGERTYKFNVSIYNPFMKNLKLNWNGTNFTIYNESLILMYNFDNLSALGESSTFIKDLSKYGNNGSIIGAKWTSSGKYNGGYSFDGTSSNYVIIPSFGNLQGDYTVSVWLKKNDVSNCIILSKGGDGSLESDNYKNIELRIQNDKLRFWYGNTGATGLAVDFYGNSILTKDKWYLLTAVKSGLDIKLYVNGQLDGSATATSVPYQTTSPLKIANYFWKSAWYAGCNGTIDELRIWNRSLTSSEINKSYMSNLYKYNSTQWYLYVNQFKNPDIELDFGRYTYQAFSQNSIGDEGKTELRNITIIPSGVNQVFWSNMLGIMINSADKKDRVKLIARGSALTGNLEYEIWKSGFLWFNTKVASQTSELGFITWIANESGSYWFQARREGETTWITSDNLVVSNTENNFVPIVNITSPETGDLYLNSEPIEFKQSAYDEDDFFDYVWDLGDGITKYGDSETYDNYNFTFNSYTSSGQKNINLEAVDERGAGDSDEKSIFVININRIANYTFAYITKPGWGESVDGPLVRFNATKSFAIEVNSSKNLTCLGGDCPSTTKGGSIIYNSYNLKGNYNNMNFSWSFDDGDKYYVRGVNGTNFTKVFGKSGQHNAQLTVIIPNANSLSDTSFDMRFVNYCEADGLKYWNVSGSSFDTLTSTNPLGCGGLNGNPGGNDDCCPANYGCTATGCKLNLTIQQWCNNVSFCSDYKDSLNCSLDLCRVGSDSACGGIVQTGANCNDDFFVKINCSCKYKGTSPSGKCELNSQIRGSIFQPNYELIYYCNTTTNHGNCNTQNGFMRVQMNSTLTGTPAGCDLNESLCSTEQGSVVCGAAGVRLPFFTFFNFIFSLILIFFIYTIVVLKRKVDIH